MGKTKNLKTNEKKALSIAHPNSRKAAKLTKQTIRNEGKKKQKIKNALKQNLFGEKLFWFKENLDEDVANYSAEKAKELFLKYLRRFDEELEQINLKHSIGQRKNRQHASRQDSINITIEKDKNEFNGGGIEMVDIMNPAYLAKLKSWDGNMGYLNQMKMKFFSQNYFNRLMTAEVSNSEADSSEKIVSSSSDKILKSDLDIFNSDVISSTSDRPDNLSTQSDLPDSQMDQS